LPAYRIAVAEQRIPRNLQAEELDHPGGLLVIDRCTAGPQKRLRRLACLSCLVGSVSTSSHAAGFTNTIEGTSSLPVQDRVVSVAVFSLYGPKYLGAERYGPFAYPTLDIRRPNEPFALDSPDDGLSFAAVDTPVLKLGPVASLRQGRNAGVDHRFTGLDHDPWAVEAGIFIDYWPVPDRLRTRAELRHGLRGQDGFALDLSADWFERTGRFTLSIGPRLVFLDASLAQLQFGVSPAASVRNRLFAPYAANGGLQTVGVSSAVAYDWSEAWRTTLYERYDRLVGDAAASTITKRLGAGDQLTVGVGVTYTFHSDLPFLP
jgi:outer membrane scaffolding protein for murein synthesis (MipA/OmpV family)